MAKNLKSQSRPKSNGHGPYELCWSGKLTAAEVLSRWATANRAKPVFTSPTGKLFFGDNSKVIASLLPAYAGQFDLIYLDPPYGVGGNFFADTESSGTRGKRAYSDPALKSSGFDVQSIFERLVLVRELLSTRGTLYLQCDWRLSALYRMLLDEVFGRDCFLNHVIWSYKTGGVPNGIGFAKKHDDIFVYSKGSKPIFHPPAQKSYVPSLPEPHTTSGKRLGVKRDNNCELCRDGSPGQKYRWVKMRDVWDDVPALFRNDAEIVGYDTQKPERLLERIILTSSNPQSLVGDFFCGSGTTGAVAKRLGRRWVLCDSSKIALRVAKRRLAKAEAAK